MFTGLFSRLRPAARAAAPAAETFRDNPRTLLFFLHIPKTAGTAVTDSLRAHFAAERIFPSYAEADLVGRDRAALCRDYDFAHAHAGANVAFAVATHVFTVLREPTARILSLYNYWRSVPLDSATVFAGGLVDPAVTLAKELSFEAFVFSEHHRILNDLRDGQVYQIATSNTDQGRAAARDMSPDAVLELACANVARMGAIGVTEELPEFAARMERAYGIGIDIARRNVTRERYVELDALGAEARARIEALTELDRTLYDRVRSGRLGAAG